MSASDVASGVSLVVVVPAAGFALSVGVYMGLGHQDGVTTDEGEALQEPYMPAFEK